MKLNPVSIENPSSAGGLRRSNPVVYPCASGNRFPLRKAAIVALILILVSGFGLTIPLIQDENNAEKFNGERAWQDVDQQIRFGPRIPGSQAHADTVDWIRLELEEAGWQVELQEAVMLGHPIVNIIAQKPGSAPEDAPWFILGAHYDSRIYADKDPDPAKRLLPVPGANDGASGAAVLLELGRVLPDDISKDIWLVFFDAEDNGNISGWDWILGSRAFVDRLEGEPDAAVIVDMIGDADLNIYKEGNSDPGLMDEIWAQAEELGYADRFIPEYKYHILDDHTPFIEAGIPAADLIDFDYPFWHTTEDTLDKVSPESLQVVGETLYAWLTGAAPREPVLNLAELPGIWIERLLTLVRRVRLR